MKHELPKLPYSYGVLEPYIDARTMEIHHSKHHAAYVAKLNEALEKYPETADKPLEELLKDLGAVPEEIRTVVRNNGGGHYNHSLFWRFMRPVGGNGPSGKLAEQIEKTFGGFQSFKDSFSKAAAGQFGSGWAWLVLGDDKALKIIGMANQDSPISQGLKPILGVDVWEHAYYLKYQNRRAEYVEAWWNVVDWECVENIFSGEAY